MEDWPHDVNTPLSPQMTPVAVICQPIHAAGSRRFNELELILRVAQRLRNDFRWTYSSANVRAPDVVFRKFTRHRILSA